MSHHHCSFFETGIFFSVRQIFANKCFSEMVSRAVPVFSQKRVGMSVPFSNTHLRVPRGFGNVLEGLAREVLRDQPRDIPAYAAQYFKALLKEREESGLDPAEWSARLEDRFYNNHAFKQENQRKTNDSPEKDEAAVKIQATYRGYVARQEVKKLKTSTTNLNEKTSGKDGEPLEIHDPEIIEQVQVPTITSVYPSVFAEDLDAEIEGVDESDADIGGAELGHDPAHEFPYGGVANVDICAEELKGIAYNEETVDPTPGEVYFSNRSPADMVLFSPGDLSALEVLDSPKPEGQLLPQGEEEDAGETESQVEALDKLGEDFDASEKHILETEELENPGCSSVEETHLGKARTEAKPDTVEEDWVSADGRYSHGAAERAEGNFEMNEDTTSPSAPKENKIEGDEALEETVMEVTPELKDMAEGKSLDEKLEVDEDVDHKTDNEEEGLKDEDPDEDTKSTLKETVSEEKSLQEDSQKETELTDEDLHLKGRKEELKAQEDGVETRQGEDDQEEHEDEGERGQDLNTEQGGDQTEDCAKQQEEDIMDIPLDDPEANKAAAKIQASFRGHMTRKKMKDDKPRDEVSSSGAGESSRDRESLNGGQSESGAAESGAAEGDDASAPEQ
nr:PREDICTED: uncharacterized protein LOC102685898 isoform X1 [Lepisosteus oculatus]